MIVDLCRFSDSSHSCGRFGFDAHHYCCRRHTLPAKVIVVASITVNWPALCYEALILSFSYHIYQFLCVYSFSAVFAPGIYSRSKPISDVIYWLVTYWLVSEVFYLKY